MSRIHSKLVDIDHLGLLTVDIAETGVGRATATESFDGHPMWVRYSCPSSRKVPSHEAYVAKFVAVGHEIATMVQSSEPRKVRKLQYMLEHRNFHKRLIKRILYDWAVTLGIHPWALGIYCQDQGTLTVPGGVKLSCTIVTNVFKDETRKHRLRGQEIPIPARIESLAISYSPGFAIRAVVVTEHRNLDFGASEIQAHARDVLFLQTGGYPARNLKEFLNLLSKNYKMRNVPFLYFSDHDPHGHHIFLGLKYGSKASSWSSSTQVCPKITWAGPSVAELFDTVQSYGPMRRQSRIESEPSLSAEAAALDEKKWVTLTVAKIKQKFRGKVMTKDDQELYRGIVASGVLDLEPALAKEMSQMMERAEKFSLNLLTTIRPRGVESFVVERISEIAPAASAEPINIPIAQVSQVTKAFNEATSQDSSREVSLKRATTARMVNIDMD